MRPPPTMTPISVLEPDGLIAARARAELHVFEFSSDLLGSASRDGYFTALNPAWEKRLGFSLNALMGQPFIDFVHPGDREATEIEMVRLAAGGLAPVHFEN